jgi:phosphatidylglycerophosphate synthase
MTMLDERLRPVKERLMAPLARAIGAGVSPMQVTVLAFLIGMASAVAAAWSHLAIAVTCWLANRLLDGLDGTLARTQGRQTDLGGYVDIVLDFVVYAAVPLGLAVGARGPFARDVAFATAAMLASFYVNAASWMYLAAIIGRRSVGADARGEFTTVTMPAGLIGGSETVVLYTLFLLLPTHLVVLFAVTAVLVLVTALQRLAWAARHL